MILRSSFKDVESQTIDIAQLLFGQALSADSITLALRGAEDALKEAALSSISARQRRMIEADLADGAGNVTARDIAVARRSIAQEAIRLASLDLLTLKEVSEQEAAA